MNLITQVSDWFLNAHPLVQAAIRALLLVVPILTLVPGFIWWERRLLSWMQDRIGPNRVGPFGLLQPIADGVKLFFKEDITPSAVDRAIYFIAPALALFPAFALGGTLPWGPNVNLTPVGDVNIGVLYIMAISSLGVYGVVLAGYGSDNKYSLMGGLRASAQLISYELAMGMSLACIAMLSGSMKVTDYVIEQGKAIWGVEYGIGNYIQNWNVFTPFGLLAAVIFLICMIAETNRAPFDLPEAENELIAGYHTEYSSMKFAVFFMGEYAAIFVFSGIFAAVFLGGYNLLPLRWDELAKDFPGMGNFFRTMASINYYGAPLWFIGKCTAGLTVFIWLRATLPRLRYDQLMNLGWRTLLPLAVANFVAIGGFQLTAQYLDSESQAYVIFTVVILVVLMLAGVFYRRSTGKTMGARSVEMVEPGPARTIQLVDGGKSPAAGS